LAFSLNRLMLIGNLGQDAETRFTTSNVSVTSFSIATTHSYKGKDGNWVNETTWHNVVAFNLSDYFKEALKKGKKIYIEGRLRKRDYVDKDEIKRYVTEVISEKIILLDPKESSGSYSGGTKSTSTGDSPIANNSNEEDDLPF